jgi:hypothetical protein
MESGAKTLLSGGPACPVGLLGGKKENICPKFLLIRYFAQIPRILLELAVRGMSERLLTSSPQSTFRIRKEQQLDLVEIIYNYLVFASQGKHCISITIIGLFILYAM